MPKRREPSNVEPAEGIKASYECFERKLVDMLGAVVGGCVLAKALGHRTQASFRKAHQRGTIPVSTFELDGRRGRFAITTDLAGWMWRQREHGIRSLGLLGSGPVAEDSRRIRTKRS